MTGFDFSEELAPTYHKIFGAVPASECPAAGLPGCGRAAGLLAAEAPQTPSPAQGQGKQTLRQTGK